MVIVIGFRGSGLKVPGSGFRVKTTANCRNAAFQTFYILRFDVRYSVVYFFITFNPKL